MSKVDLSVCVITYCHEKFIQQAIESIINQKVDFDIEILIGDDCSPDNTKGIIEKIIESNTSSKIIKYTRHTKNIGISENFRYILSQSQGKYIALCDGDDFWTDDLKLQKQYSFLESTNNALISFHNSNVIDWNNEKTGIVYKNEVGNLNFGDLMDGKFTKTVTCVFKKPSFFNVKKVIDDTTLFLHVLEEGGHASYLPDIMASYRIHEGGVWSKKNELKRYKLCLETENLIQENYSTKFPELSSQRLRNFYFESFIKLSANGFRSESFKTYLKYYRLEPKFAKKTKSFFILLKTNLRGLFS